MKAILAIDEKNGLGIGNALAWDIPEEMEHFRKTTKGKTIIMGKNTYLSLPQPLKGRTHVVFTSDKKFSERLQQDMLAHKCCGWTIHSMKEMEHYITSSEAQDAYLIGGKQMYETFLPYCDEILLSRVKGDFRCDVFLQYDFSSHKIVSEQDCGKYILQVLRK